MGQIREHKDEADEERKQHALGSEVCPRRPDHADGGGRDGLERPRHSSGTARHLYRTTSCGASTTPASPRTQQADARLPQSAPPLVREHRLYQADWLMRYLRLRRNGADVRSEAEPAADQDPEDDLGRGASRVLSRRRERRAARSAAARARHRLPQRRAHPEHAALPPPALEDLRKLHVRIKPAARFVHCRQITRLRSKLRRRAWWSHCRSLHRPCSSTSSLRGQL